MTSEQLLDLAEECRITAGLLFAIAIVTAATGTAVWFTLGPGNVLLACIIVVITTTLGGINERIDASNYHRRAWSR